MRLRGRGGLQEHHGSTGHTQAGQEAEACWEISVQMLHRMVAVAREHGIRLNVEPHTGSVVEEPGRAAKLARDVPGLTFTLDYSHFISRGYTETDVEPLIPHTAHVHARQARKGWGACLVAEGTIDYAGVMAALRAARWQGVIAMEYSGGRELLLSHTGAFQNVALAYQLDELARNAGARAGARSMRTAGMRFQRT